MTVGEVYDWIKATPRQHHAIGRYQFIPKTLRRLVRITGAGRDQPFTPAYQDQLADILLAEAGIHRYHAREIGRVSFMNNLAKIWAGFPNSSGRSHYHGFAGNKATMTWAQFSQEMAAIYDS
jgi:muramidase (phage lysozyme)